MEVTEIIRIVISTKLDHFPLNNHTIPPIQFHAITVI